MMLVPASGAVEPERSRLKILVADDHELIRAALRGLLWSLGHAVEVASNGREAVEAAAREAFDFIFLDVQMPEMGGFEAAGRVGLEYVGKVLPRIIGISAEADHTWFSDMAAIDDFLVKPIRLADLVRVLDRSHPSPMVPPIEIG